MIPSPPVLSVTELNRHIRSWLEHEMGSIQVEGELSNVSKPASGHLYFTLKDASAQVRCVYFRNQHRHTNTIKDGQHVVVRGKVSLYEARGDYQLIVDLLEEAGIGNLYRQFEALKIKLAALGLFEISRKKQIPTYPQCIGIITSANGAALSDMLSTLARRFPIAAVLIYASEVQGAEAPRQLIERIEQANRNNRCDVLLLARGGGSIEDLWAFNDERLAHAIAASQIPIISGVGHETDFTISDFVADLRAETPTAAAVAATPNGLELLTSLRFIETQLLRGMLRILKEKQWQLDRHVQKITSPHVLINTHSQSLDYHIRHLHQSIRQTILNKQQILQMILLRLSTLHPKHQLQQIALQRNELVRRLLEAINKHLLFRKQQLTEQQLTLYALSPLATLSRGYAIVTHHSNVIRSTDQVQLGDTITIRLAKGELKGDIIARDPEDTLLAI